MAFTLGRIPTTNDELYWYVRIRFGRAIPRTRVCAGHVSPFEAFADAFFGRNSINPESGIDSIALWHGSRGLSGKSYMLSLLAVTMAELLGAPVNLLGGSMAQSMNIHEHVATFMTSLNAPEYMVIDSSNSRIALTNGAVIRPLTASQKTVRGPHPPRLLLDEIDEMDIKILDAALGQPMPQRNYLGQTVKPYTVMCLAGDSQVLTPDGEVFLSKMRVGMKVMTRGGWRSVRRVFFNGYRPVIRVGLSNGRALTCTEDHRIATPGGWLQAGGLTVGQEVCGAGPGLVVGEDRLDEQPLGPSAPVVFPGLLSVSDPLAGLADSSPALGQASVLDREPVPLGAVGLSGVQDAGGAASMQVCDRGDGLEVRRVTAGEAGTSTGCHVVDLVAVGNRPDQALVGPDVHAASMDGSAHHPVAPGLGSVPDPASAGVDGAPGSEPVFVVNVGTGLSRHVTVPVYDLEVEGIHEYVAEGITVSNCSTWQNPEGTFTEIQRRAEEKEYPIYQWCYRESANPVDGWLTQATIDEKKNSTSKAMWETEYELNEPSIGTRAFDGDAVEAMFSLPHSPLAKREAKDFWEYLFEKPQRFGRYVAAADWGKEKDYTVISVIRIDRHPYELVYWMKVNRRPWPVMIGWFDKAIARYHAEAIHDATGLGDVVDDYTKVDAEGFQMRGAPRADMLTEYVNGVEKGHLRFPKVKDIWQAHRYCQVQDLYSSSKEFHLPDEVCSLALAFHVAHQRAPIAGPVSVPKGEEPRQHEMTNADQPDPTTPRRMGDVERRGWDSKPGELSLTV